MQAFPEFKSTLYPGEVKAYYRDFEYQPNVIFALSQLKKNQTSFATGLWQLVVIRSRPKKLVNVLTLPANV